MPDPLTPAANIRAGKVGPLTPASSVKAGKMAPLPPMSSLATGPLAKCLVKACPWRFLRGPDRLCPEHAADDALVTGALAGLLGESDLT